MGEQGAGVKLAELRVISLALARAGGNVSRAARALGKSRGWVLVRIGSGGGQPGRPRRVDADAAIGRLLRTGASRREIVTTLKLAGIEVSPGTVLRRMKEEKT